MLKRELTRIGIIGGVGIIIMLSMMFGGENSMNLSAFIIPFYLIGMFYAGQILLNTLGVVAKIYFSCQFMSFLINPLRGTVICLILLFIGLACIISLGWLIGIGRCIYCLVNAYQIDRQCMESKQEYYW